MKIARSFFCLVRINGYREWSQDLRADPRNPTTTEDAKYLRDSDHGGSDESKT